MEFGVLGPLRARDGDRDIDLGPPKQRLVLALLLCEAGRAVSLDGLIDAIWGSDAPPSAAGNVYLYLSRLRKTLGAERITGRGRGGYTITIAPDELDAARFTELADTGRDALATGDAATASRNLRDALALWRGTPFTGLPDVPALRQQAARLTERYHATVEYRIDADLASGYHAEVVAELHTMVERHPFRERFHEQLMLALYRCGRQADALAAYHGARRVLQDELGLEPGPGLQRLERAILIGDPALDLEQSDPGPRPIGTGTVAPEQLPPAVADFTGREGYLEEMDLLAGEDFAPHAPVVIAITGMAGVGKTALAVWWGRRARDRFPDGQVYLDLRGHAPVPAMPPIEALTLMLRALGVPADHIPVGVEEACGLYRTTLSARRVLLLLDNADHADQIRPLLPTNPGCLALVTSRNRLTGLIARDGARRLSLEMFTDAESVALLTRMLGPGRAERERDALSRLATACGNLPLALRVAGANLIDRPDHTVAGFVDGLLADSRLANLEVAGDPQASVRVAFELSYATLKPRIRVVFRVLGLAPGPHVTPAAAAALANLPVQTVDELLEALAAACLLTVRGSKQYVMHDLLRSYARELSEAEDDEAERAASRQRLHDYYLRAIDAVARAAYPHMVRLHLVEPAAATTNADDALAWVDAELPNLVAVVREAGALGLPAAWLLADGLRGYFWMRRHTTEWLAVGEAGLAAAVARDDEHGRAAAHLSLGLAYRGLEAHTQAIEHLDAAMTASRKAGWLEATASAVGSLAVIHAERGDTAGAVAHFDEALALNRHLRRRGGEAVTLGNLSTLRHMLGDLRHSVEDAIESLALYRETGSIGGEALMLTNLGLTYLDLGRFPAALDHLNEGLTIHERIGDRYGRSLSHIGLARAHGQTGRAVDGRDHAVRALDLASEIDNPEQRAMALRCLATIEHHLGDDLAALGRATEARRLARTAHNPHAESETLVEMATALRRLGRLNEALSVATQAHALTHPRGYRLVEGQALGCLAAIHLAARRPGPAATAATAALACHRHTGHRLGEARALLLLHHCDGDATGTDNAGPAGHALTILAEIGVPAEREIADLHPAPANAGLPSPQVGRARRAST